jgi:hypothetical protein
MALMPVYYNSWSSGKKKPKFKSAEAKRQYEECQKSEFGIAKKRTKVYNMTNTTSNGFPSYSAPPGRETQKIPSRGTGIGNATRAEDKVYTGTKMIGIGTLHKSNAVPVFCDDEAKAMANMRR